MKTPQRVVLFGVISGLLWSAAPIWFSDRTRQIFAMYLPAGVITGILISLALYRTLQKASHWRTFLLGVFALPLSAFFFGLFVGLILAIAGYPSGDSVAPSHNPLAAIYSGLLFAYMTLMLSLFSCLGLLFFPLAILNTWLLRSIVRPRTDAPA